MTLKLFLSGLQAQISSSGIRVNLFKNSYSEVTTYNDQLLVQEGI